ncbi:MAG: class I SAM-dependent methyltransferase [Rhodobacteraceae bacterium]|nr:class I SAM-dependent methyltransferase [Paracoccaceae bacterium]
MNRCDFSMMTDADVANIVLQRSEVVHANQQIRDWMSGDDAPLLALAQEKRDEVLQTAFETAQAESDLFVEATDEIAPKRIADIGCGYGFVDLCLYRRYDCDLVLIDIESGNDRHFGFSEQHPGYTSLDKARQFLEGNGVPSERITTINPTKTPVEDAGSFDLALSLLSCGFHYPVDTYETLFRDQVNPSGGILLDIRRGSGGKAALKKFGALTVLVRQNKHAKILARKAPAA